MTRQSHRDPAPIGWEIPAAAGGAWLTGAALGLPFAQAAASWLFADGFVWPRRLPASVLGLLRGRPGDGLTMVEQTRLAGAAGIYTVAVIVEVALVVVAGWAAVWWWQSSGPGSHPGMATKTDAEKALGVSNLRRRRKEIRPDLYMR